MFGERGDDDFLPDIVTACVGRFMDDYLGGGGGERP